MPELPSILQQALAPAYTLERELAGGGMSRVFVANDVALSRKVVVKVLPPELSAGVNHERFRREIQVVAQLQHPHIVPLLSAGEQGSLIWYTMPFINGRSLREAITRGERFAVKDVVRIMRDVAEALDHAHGMGVIHRDIKPGNVLLMGSHALVTDFGVAKAISVSMPSSGFTSAGMAIGTPAYMAPEQIAADPAADHRMDLYALGLLAYEMLTGQVPFQEDSPQKTMAAQLTRDPSPVEQTRGDVPPALSALVRHLLAKVPDDRPPRASDVIAVLDEIALTSGQQLAPLRPTRKPSLGRTALVAVAGVAVIAFAWISGQRTGTEVGTAMVRDSLAAADSHEVVASAAAMLTREDSMAIAQAVSARMAQRMTVASAPPSVAYIDSVRAQIQRTVLDSLVQLGARMRPGSVRVMELGRALPGMPDAPAVNTATENGASMPPAMPAVRPGEPRRVVVAPPRPSRSRPDVDAVGTALIDSLRARIDAHPHYVVIAADSVAAALRESRTIDGVQEKLGADLIVSVSLVPSRDSVVRVITMHDLTLPAGADRRVIVSPVASADPTAGIGALMPQVVPTLLEMERSGRRRPPRPAPRASAPAVPQP